MSSGPGLLPTSQRAIPLAARPDLIARRIYHREEANWVIKDPISLQYHRLQEAQYSVLQLLDGDRSLETIRKELRKQFPTLHVALADVQSLVTDLHRKGLVFSKRPGQAPTLIERDRAVRHQKIKNTLRSFLFLKLPGWDPEWTLSKLYPLVRWMFRPAVVAFCLAFVAASLILFGVQFEQFRKTMPEFQQFFAWPNLLYLWLTIGLCKIAHEFGHGLACKHYGGECHEMGMMLLVFSPTLYCDATDSWMLKNKWHRIIIASAGMYVELLISAFAIFLWWNTENGLIHHLCLNVFLVTSLSTIIFNANPLMRYDGYYIFSDLVEIPNLRTKATKMLKDKFAWYCLGIESKPDPFEPETGRNWLAGYAVAAAAYRILVLSGILLFLYTFLKPHGLQSLGIALAVFSAGGMIVALFMGIYQILKTPRSEPMSYRKLTVTLLVLAGLIAAGLMIRFPLHGEAPFLVEPQDGKDVLVVTPGRLIKLHVKPGDPVKRGQLLAELENTEIDDRIEELVLDREITTKRLASFRSLQNQAGEQLTLLHLKNIAIQLKDLDNQRQQLKLVAPCDGTVVAPTHVPEQFITDTSQPLPRWTGTPLNPRNAGCYLDRRTHLLTVAPSEKLVAVAYVDQAQRNELAVGQSVELKFDHLPTDIFDSSVTEISQREREFAPPELSNKYGGELATVTDSQGRERLSSRAYPATVPLDGDSSLFRSGMRGRARIVLARRTGAEWVWRKLRQTFKFRL